MYPEQQHYWSCNIHVCCDMRCDTSFVLQLNHWPVNEVMTACYIIFGGDTPKASAASELNWMSMMCLSQDGMSGPATQSSLWSCLQIPPMFVNVLRAVWLAMEHNNWFEMCIVILICSGGSREFIYNCLPTFDAIQSLWLLPCVHMCEGINNQFCLSVSLSAVKNLLG